MTGTSHAAQAWLTSTLDALQTPVKSLESLGNSMALAMSQATQHFSDTPAAIELPHADGVWQPPNWSAIDTVQILIVLSALAAHEGAAGMRHRDIIELAYQYGDDRERMSVMKGLYWLDNTGDMTLFAVDAGRTNSTQLFSSIALNNLYPNQFYNEPQFNQLVLKALFIDLDIEHIVGLRERKNSELMRMCDDFSKERCAAGRPIPPSLWLTIDCEKMSETMLALFLCTMVSDDIRQRYYAARSLEWQVNLPKRVREIIRERLALEPEKRIHDLLLKAGC